MTRAVRLTLTVLALLCLCAPSALAQLNISNSPAIPSIDPRLATDSLGNVHAVWIERNSYPFGDVFYARGDFSNQQITTPVNLSQSASVYCDTMEMCAIAVDGSNRVYVLWTEGWEPDCRLRLRIYADGAWGPAETVTSGLHFRTPRIAVSAEGDIYVVFWDFQWKVRSTARVGGVWESVQLLGSESEIAKMADIDVGPGFVGVAMSKKAHSWDAYQTAYLQRGRGFNAAWTAPTLVSPSGYDEIFNSIRIDSNNTAHLTWMYESGSSRIVQYVQKNAAGFTSPISVSDWGMLHFSFMAKSGDDMFVVWQVGGYGYGSSVDYAVRRSNGTWLAPQSVPNSSGVTYSDIAVAPDRSLIYFVWDTLLDIGNGEIYGWGVAHDTPTVVSGSVRTGAGGGIAGVTMSGLPGSPKTNAQGAYSGTVYRGWTGTVTPEAAGYTFAPASRNYTAIPANQTGQDYTATAAVGPPTVTTTAVTGIGSGTASSGGTVTSEGGASVTARGVCWSPSPYPTTDNTKTTDGAGLGSFGSALTGLTPNTLYHVRAYAVNSGGTAYGADLTFTTLSGSGTTFLIPFGSLDNGNVNVANIGGQAAGLTLRVRNAAGAVMGEQSATVPANGILRTWDVLGNIFDFGKPVSLEIVGSQSLVGDNIKWASPPYETVAAGFTCGPLSQMKGREFFLPFNSSVTAGEWASGYCVITNTAGTAAGVTVEVYDQNGVLKKTAAFSVPAGGTERSWDYVGSIQDQADPALLRITADQDVTVEAVRWVQNRRGWGFAIFPSAVGSGTSFLVPFGSLDNGNINLGNITGASANVTLRVLDPNGVNLKEQSFTIPARGVRRTWDLVGNIYTYGKPVSVEITSDRALVGDNIKWAGPPYETVSAGFTCGPLTQMKGRGFALPFNSSVTANEWANGYCVIANTAAVATTVTVTVFDALGTIKKTASFGIPAKGVARSWDAVGSIQDLADPALLRITADQDVVVESVRWVQNRRGWGFAILPIY